jgi:hypothetical protein
MRLLAELIAPLKDHEFQPGDKPHCSGFFCSDPRLFFQLASGRKKKQFVASQNCEKAYENRRFSTVFRFQ